MKGDDAIEIAGNMTRDPELRFTKTEKAMVTFGIAMNRSKPDGNGGWEELDPTFVDVTAFGQLAENIAESVTKGARVRIYGRLELDSWETEAGEKRSKLKVLADDVCVSLAYATAEVSRNERAEGNGRSNGRTNGRSSGARPKAKAKAQVPDYDEEPF